MKVNNWKDIIYFNYWEFDSPDVKGSGKLMEDSFIRKLDLARSIAGVQGEKEGIKIIFKVNSGYRTQSYNDGLKNSVKNSSHIKGWAADIRIRNNKERRIILNSLIKSGLDRRIGISDTFIHVDDDPSKSNSYWTYNNKNKITSFIKSIFNNNETEDI